MMNDAMAWLIQQVQSSTGRFLDHMLEDSSLHTLQADIDLIMQEWYRRYPSIEVAPGVTIAGFTLAWADKDEKLLTVEAVREMLNPNWEIQFADAEPICKYETYELYSHCGFILAYHANRKYLVCSELSAHQTAQEMYLIGQRVIRETEVLLQTLPTDGEDQ